MHDAARNRPPTWEDLDEVPEGFVGEIVAGEIVVTPRPDAPHASVASDLGMVLGPPFRFGTGGPGGWVILFEPGIQFGEDMRIPDLAAWRTERFVRPRHGPFRVIPDWVCEVLSRRTAFSDRTKKMPLYAHHGVRFAWLVDPLARTLEVYRLEGDAWAISGTYGEDMVARVEPFDAIELNLGVLWPEIPDDE